MRAFHATRGIALVVVLIATALLLAVVTVLVDLGTLQLRRATADLWSVQALGGADAGTAWVRALFYQQQGDQQSTIAKLAASQGRHRFAIDDRTYVVATITLSWSNVQGSPNDHVDDNVESNARALEQVVQVSSAAALYVDNVVVTHRVTNTMLRIFPSKPYSEVVGYVDDAAPVGIDSPGDAAGQLKGPNSTELLVHAYTIVSGLTALKNADDFSNLSWSDGNSSGPGPLP